MKVYIFTDMEGVSGIHRVEFAQRGTDRYEEGRKLMTADANAAIAGCFDGGATEVVVRDWHANGDNFVMEEMDARAVIDHGGEGAWWGCLDESFDAVLIVGMHAMAGTMNAFLDHTQNSGSWYEYLLNGRAVGETGQIACLAGGFDKPVVMVSGDKAATEEATQLLGPIEVAAVKEGTGRGYAVCLAPKKARELIRQAACRSLKLAKKIKPWKPKLPIEVVLKLNRTDTADTIAFRPGNERVDSRTVRRVVNEASRILEIFLDARPTKKQA